MCDRSRPPTPQAVYAARRAAWRAEVDVWLGEVRELPGWPLRPEHADALDRQTRPPAWTPGVERPL